MSDEGNPAACTTAAQRHLVLLATAPSKQITQSGGKFTIQKILMLVTVMSDRSYCWYGTAQRNLQLVTVGTR